jgi:3-oxoacyl-[acyl-carrier protein] reductase
LKQIDHHYHNNQRSPRKITTNFLRFEFLKYIPHMNLSLEGKTALICGSTQGIGLATAIELSALGATCILIARNETALQEALRRLWTPAAQTHRYAIADFSDTAAVKTAAEQLATATPVHILINNTGGPAAGPASEAAPEAFLAAFNQHLINNHNLVQTLLPGMKAAGYGRIINIISTSVKIPLPNLGVSNTIRGAVASWAKTMANELAQFGITVNNVLPGATRTGRLENIVKANAAKKGIAVDEAEAEMMREIPARRFGEAEEIAAVAAFLATPAAAYINGVSIPVDGGRTGSI